MLRVLHPPYPRADEQRQELFYQNEGDEESPLLFFTGGAHVLGRRMMALMRVRALLVLMIAMMSGQRHCRAHIVSPKHASFLTGVGPVSTT